MVGSIDAEQTNTVLPVAFANTAPITNHGVANVHTGVMAGYINNEFGANGYYAAPGDKESE